MPDQSQSPLNPLPPVVWALALPIVAMEVVLGLASAGLIGGPEAIGWRIMALERFAFAPQILSWMWETGRWPWDQAIRIVTYPFVHINFTHAAFVLVFLLALGKMAGEVFRPVGVLVVFFGAAIVGALAYTLFGTSPRPLVGGYPAVYGLIGAFTFIMWVRLGAVGANRMGAFGLIGVLMGLQLLFGVLFGGSQDWIAELAGFATGFLVSFLLVPGGVARVMAMLRQRR
jgi:membrane associated rhomboid family serine protease